MDDIAAAQAAVAKRIDELYGKGGRAKLARELGKSRSWVTTVLTDPTTGAGTLQTLADAVGLEVRVAVLPKKENAQATTEGA